MKGYYRRVYDEESAIFCLDWRIFTVDSESVFPSGNVPQLTSGFQMKFIYAII